MCPRLARLRSLPASASRAHAGCGWRCLRRHRCSARRRLPAPAARPTLVPLRRRPPLLAAWAAAVDRVSSHCPSGSSVTTSAHGIRCSSRAEARCACGAESAPACRRHFFLFATWRALSARRRATWLSCGGSAGGHRRAATSCSPRRRSRASWRLLTTPPPRGRRLSSVGGTRLMSPPRLRQRRAPLPRESACCCSAPQCRCGRSV